ncbi:MAG: hypothetical protein ACLRMZ_23935 [Blautia marasmi]
MILNVPIAICLGLSSVCAILYSGTSLTIVATNMYSGISKFLLLAIPFLSCREISWPRPESPNVSLSLSIPVWDTEEAASLLCALL